MAGYEELIKLFATLDNEKSPEFSKFAGMMKKIVTDNNAVAQEKGLDAVIAFVENASTNIAGRYVFLLVTSLAHVFALLQACPARLLCDFAPSGIVLCTHIISCFATLD